MRCVRSRSSQGFLGPLQLADVRVRPEPPDHPPAVVLDRLDPREERAGHAVLALDRDHHVERLGRWRRTPATAPARSAGPRRRGRAPTSGPTSAPASCRCSRASGGCTRRCSRPGPPSSTTAGSSRPACGTAPRPASARRCPRRRDEVVRLALGRAGERDGQLDADERPVLADVPLLRRVRRDLPGQESPDVGEVGVEVVGVGDVLERQPHHLVVAVAHDVAELLVDPQPAAVQPDVGDADRRLLEGGPEPLLTFSTGLFSPFLFGGFPHRSPPRTKTPRCSRTALATDHPATAREVDYTHLRQSAR